MLEPVLTLDPSMTVAEALLYLTEYQRFRHVALYLEWDGGTEWFMLHIEELHWLLGDADRDQLLRGALELDTTTRAPTFDGPIAQVPPAFIGLVLADGEAVAVALQPEDVDLAAYRGASNASERLPGTTAVEREDGAIETTEPRRRLIAVFYATDRAGTGRPGPDGLFGSERGELVFGKIDVSIPRGHKRGQVETPKFWKLEFGANDERHVALRSARRYDRLEFLTAMERRFDESGAREALVFVHGYRVTFDAAIRRTGQIAHDLRFEGTPILYSWPSAGRLLRYAQDETSARWTEPHFIRFLQVLLNESAAEAVHVIAHSMGTRIVSECLRNLPPAINTSKLDQVVLAAPDIDAETFKDMAGALEGRTKQVTMYASSRDLALRVSKLVHGYPRAGDTDPEVVLVKPVMTVDASSVDTNLLGHAYVGDDKSILADIFHLLQSRATPDQRRFFLDPAEQNGERYWVFVT